MKIILRVVGMIKSGPERDLINAYLARSLTIGKTIGFMDISENQIDPRGESSKSRITDKLVEKLDSTDLVIALDGRGKSFSSMEIANKLAVYRDDSVKHVCFLIGGAEGLDKSCLSPNTQYWCFGRQTWPHRLVRVMLAEQIYRALSILSGSPYHKD